MGINRQCYFVGKPGQVSDRLITKIGLLRHWTLAAAVFVLLSLPGPSWAIIVSFWEITNTTGIQVTDAELKFIGTGGTISDPEILPGPGATIGTTTMGNGVSIEWPMGLPPGGETNFFFFTDNHAGIEFDSGTWTLFGIPNADIIKTDGSIKKLNETNVNISEPSSVLLLPVALAALWAGRRGLLIRVRLTDQCAKRRTSKLPMAA
jgi:hypothetical protein